VVAALVVAVDVDVAAMRVDVVAVVVVGAVVVSGSSSGPLLSLSWGLLGVLLSSRVTDVSSRLH